MKRRIRRYSCIDVAHSRAPGWLEAKATARSVKEAWKECGAAPLRRLRSRSLGRVSTRLTTESDREARFEPAEPSQLPAFGAALEDADTLYENGPTPPRAQVV